MKKLIAAIAIAFVALASQGAAVTWTINNIQASPDAAVSAGWIVQIFSSDTVYYYDAAKAGTITALDSAAAVASGTIFKASGTYGDYAANTAVNTYAVIYDATSIADAKNYIVSDVLSKSVNASGSPLSTGFGNMGGTAASNMFLNSSWTAVPSESVPEPTSGLLLLLGVAGLALRRRRA